jgi:hypothetical protein
MIDSWFYRSLWLLLFLVFWIPELQRPKIKFTLATLAVILYGALIFIAWWIIFTLPQPLTDLAPGEERTFDKRYKVLSYNDDRIIAEADSAFGMQRLVFISLRDGKQAYGIPFKEETYIGVKNFQWACNENTEAYLLGNPVNTLLGIRGDSVLILENVTTGDYPANSLFYDDSAKQFVVTSRFLGRNPDSIVFHYYDGNFKKIGDKQYKIDRRALDTTGYDSPVLFSFAGVSRLYGKLVATSFYNVFIGLRESAGKDSLIPVRVLPDQHVTLVELSPTFLHVRNPNYGYRTSTGIHLLNFPAHWKNDTTPDVNWNMHNLKFNGGEMFPDYSCLVPDTGINQRFETIMDKYLVRYETYVRDYRSTDWTMSVTDTITKRVQKFSFFNDGFNLTDFFLSGDTMVILADDMQQMARFDLKSGRRLDEVSNLDRFVNRVYFYRSYPEITYNILLILSYFLIPFTFILWLFSRIFFKKRFWPWMTLQRFSIFYVVVAMMTLIQICGRVW